MLQDKPSETALRAARSRARHLAWDQPPLLDDPLALRILGEEGRQIQSAPPPDSGVEAAMRGGIVARSRLCEDALAEAVKRGVRQYVILGAGLDTFAHRNPHAAEGLRVFEVDHPATQAWKHRMLESAGVAPAQGLRYAPVDFASEPLGVGLARAGFDPAQPAFFAWLGVVWYLPREAALDTLRFVAGCAPGSAVFFDCWRHPRGFDVAGHLVLGMLRRRYARIGEPWVTFFSQRRLGEELRELGFSDVKVMACPDINRRLFDERHRHLRLRGRQLYAFVEARV